LDGALEDRAEDDQALVGGAAAGATLVEQLVAPLLDVVWGDLLDAPPAERGQQMGANDRTVVRGDRGFPVAVMDTTRATRRR
jgi:hypothetical protein